MTAYQTPANVLIDMLTMHLEAKKIESEAIQKNTK
tara:strand:- start:438 stop:542 length:105 start_codon:yes stop_codon:yes gene_type:complete